MKLFSFLASSLLCQSIPETCLECEATYVENFGITEGSMDCFTGNKSNWANASSHLGMDANIESVREESICYTQIFEVTFGNGIKGYSIDRDWVTIRNFEGDRGDYFELYGAGS